MLELEESEVIESNEPVTSNTPVAPNGTSEVIADVQDKQTKSGLDTRMLDEIDQGYKPDNIDDARWKLLVNGVIKQESGGNADVKESTYGKLPKGKRAYGIGQILPSTAKAMGFSEDEIKNDPYANYAASVKYLAHNWTNIRNHKKVADDNQAFVNTVASYHAGDTRVLQDLDNDGDGVPDVDDGGINTRTYTKRIIDRLGPDFARLQEEEANAAIKVSEDLATADAETGNSVDASNQQVAQSTTTPVTPQQSGVLASTVKPVEQTTEDMFVEANKKVRDLLGVRVPDTYPHKVFGIDVSIPIKPGQKITGDVIGDGITDALTGQQGYGEKFRQATGENAGQIRDDVTEAWLQQEIDAGRLQFIPDANVEGAGVLKGRMQVQNYVKNRIDAYAKGGAQGVKEATALMDKEVADSSRLVAEQEYGQQIQRWKAEAEKEKDPERKKQMLMNAAAWQTKLDTEFPRSWVSAYGAPNTESLSAGIRSGLADAFTSYQQLGLNMRNLTELVTEDMQSSKSRLDARDKAYKNAMNKLQSETVATRTFGEGVVNALTKGIAYDFPFYAAGGAVVGQGGLVAASILDSVDDPPVDAMVNILTAALFEPIASEGLEGITKLLAKKTKGSAGVESIEKFFEGSLGNVIKEGFGESAGDAVGNVVQGKQQDFKQSLISFIAGGAFGVGGGGHRGDTEQVRVNQDPRQFAMPKSPVWLTMGEDGKPRYMMVIGNDQGKGMVEVPPNHPFVVKYGLLAESGGMPFLSTDEEDFDAALEAMKGEGKVAPPKMNAQQVRQYMEFTGQKGSKTTEESESSRMSKEVDERLGKRIKDRPNSVEAKPEAVSEEVATVEATPSETKPVTSAVEEETSPDSEVVSEPVVRKERTFGRDSDKVTLDDDLITRYDSAKKAHDDEVESAKSSSKEIASSRKIKAGQKFTAEKKKIRLEQETREQQLKQVYEKLGTDNLQEIGDIIVAANMRYRQKNTEEEQDTAELAYEFMQSLDQKDHQALARILPDRQYHPAGAVSPEAHINSVKGTESDAQLDANLKAAMQFFADAQRDERTVEANLSNVEAENKRGGDYILRELRKKFAGEEPRATKDTGKEVVTEKQAPTPKPNTKTVKQGGISINLPEELATKWERALEVEKNKIAALKGTVDEKTKAKRAITAERRKEQTRIIDEYKKAESTNLNRAYMKSTGKPVEIVERREEFVLVRPMDSQDTKLVRRNEVQTVKEKKLTATSEPNIPVVARLQRRFMGLTGKKPSSTAKDGVVYVNDAMRKQIENAIGGYLHLGATFKGKSVDEAIEKLNKAGLQTVAKQFERQAANNNNTVAVVDTEGEFPGKTKVHEKLHQTTDKAVFSDEAMRRLFAKDGNVIKLLDANRKTGGNQLELGMDPQDLVQEIIAYGLTGSYEQLGVEGDLLYDALLDVIEEFTKEYGDDVPKIKKLAMVNFSEITRDLEKRAKDDKTDKVQAGSKQETGSSDKADASKKKGPSEAAVKAEQTAERELDEDIKASTDFVKGIKTKEDGSTEYNQENKESTIADMGTPDVHRLHAESRKARLTKKMLEYDEKSWTDFSMWAKTSELSDDEQVRLKSLLDDGLAASTEEENEKAIENLVEFIDSIADQDLLTFLSTVVKSFMLSGLKTQGRNVLSNLGHFVLEESKRGFAAPLDVVLASLSTDKKRTVQGVSPKAIMRALRKATYDGGFRAFKDTMRGKSGATFETFNVNYDPKVRASWFTLGKPGASVLNYTLGNFAKYVFRLQSAGDVLFRQYAQNRALYEIAWLEEKNGGRKVAETLADPDALEIDMAARAAEVMVFQNDNALNTRWQQWKAAAPAPFDFAMDWLAPFVKTGANIFKRVLDYAVVGGVWDSLKYLKQMEIATDAKGWEKTKQKLWEAVDTPDFRKLLVEQSARGMVGSMIFIAGYKLAAAGLLYGMDDDDEKERNKRIAQGAGAGHIRLGDQWHDIRAIAPFSTILLAGASVQRAKTKEKKPGKDSWNEVFGVTSELVLNGLPLARQAKDLTDGKMTFDKIIGAERIIPSIVAEVAQQFDPVARDASADSFSDKIKNRIKARIPGLRETLPERVDPFGNPIQQPKVIGGTSPIPLALNITSAKQAKDDPAVDEAAVTGAGLNMPDRKTNKDGTKESKEDHQKRVKAVGDLLHRAITAALQNPNYPKSAPKAERKEIIENLADDARQEFKEDGAKVSDEALKKIVGLIIEKHRRIDAIKDEPGTRKYKHKKGIISKQFNRSVEAADQDDDTENK